MFLVTGPTGNTGRMVLEGLSALGLPVTAMVRSDERQHTLEAGGFTTVRGDFRDPASLRAALDGVETAYLVCTPDERLVDAERAFIAAARDAGVQRLVKCGAHSASHQAGSPNLRMHAVVEDALRASGLAYTIVRPHGFMQTFFWMSAPLVMEHGILAFPGGEGRIPLIDLRDVGAAMLAALTQPGHEGREYDLTGPELLSGARMAEALSAALGRPIHYMDAPESQLDAAMRQFGVPDAPREHVLWAFREQRAGHFDTLSHGHEALGVRLRTYDDFARDLAAGQSGSATSDFSR